MILLNGHTLTQLRRVPLESMRLTLNERGSSAAIVPANMTGIGVNSWLKDDTNPGKNIVWRVKTISQAYAADTTTVNLEHVICALRDKVMFGEVTPADITGKKTATECTAKQAIQYILSKHDDWTLGAFEYGTISNPYKFDGDNLFDALESVCTTLEDCWWDYDTTVYPFKLNIRKLATDVKSELRASRNLTAITKTVDRTGMFTRFYPIGKDDLHLKDKYVSKNTGDYGVVSRIETDVTLDTEKELKNWANHMLRRHAQPVVTITVDGLELADATGQTLDRLHLGKKCRVPLPEFGTTIIETITELNYPDKVNQPEVVKITLANAKNDVSRIVAETIKKGGKTTRSNVRQDKTDHAWIEDTDDHVRIVAEAVGGVDENGNVSWKKISEIMVDGNGISQRVTKTEGDLVKAEGRIDITESFIDSTVKAVGKDGKVTVASITQAINKGGSSIGIRADKIFFASGSSDVDANGNLLSNIMTMDNSALKFNRDVRVDSSKKFTVNTLVFPAVNGDEGQVVSNAQTINGGVLAGMVKSVELNAGSNTLKITKFNGDEINFSKVVSLTGEWGGVDGGRYGRTWTVSAGGGVDPLVMTLAEGDWAAASASQPALKGSWNGNYYTGYVVYQLADGIHYAKSGLQYSVNATEIFEAGEDSVTVDSIGLASNYQPLNDTQTRSTIFMQADASNGALKNDVPLLLGLTKYKSNTKNCVNVKCGDDIIGRIEIGDDAETVTVESIGLAINYQPLTNTQTRTTIFMGAEASNGNRKDDVPLLMGLTTYGNAGNRCVNVKCGDDVIGRMDVQSVFTAGRNDVKVISIGLASNYQPLDDTQTRSTIFMGAAADNGDKKEDVPLTLGLTKYSSNTKNCVNVKCGNDIIGRINIDSVLSTVTITQNKATRKISGAVTLTKPIIRAKISNGQPDRDCKLELKKGTFDNDTKACVNLYDDQESDGSQRLIGRIEVLHNVTEFDTTHADTKTEYRDYKNNSSGYYIKSGSGRSTKIGIVVNGSWKCDGFKREKVSNLETAPTNIYQYGWDQGRALAGKITLTRGSYDENRHAYQYTCYLGSNVTTATSFVVHYW